MRIGTGSYDLNEELGRHRATYIGKLTLPIIIFTISLGYKEEYMVIKMVQPLVTFALVL